MYHRELLSGASVVFFIKFFGAILAVLSNILLSRFLGAENVGIYFLSLTVVNIAIVISMFGLSNAIIKYSAQSYAKRDWESLLGLHRNSAAIITFTATISTLLIILLAPWFASSFFHKPELSAPLRWMALIVLPTNFIGIYICIFKGMQNIVPATIAESLVVSLLMIVLLLIFKDIINVSTAAMCLVAATVTNLFFGVIIWRMIISDQKRSRKYFDIKKLLQTSLPLYAVALMNMVMSMSDIVMLGLWQDSHVIGIYGVALRIAAVSSMCLVVVNTIVAPKFSILYEKGDYDALSQIARASTFLMVIIAALFLILFISIPGIVLSLFGEEFVAGKTILIILAIGQFVVLSTGPVAALLMMTGHEKFHRNTTIYCAVLNIVLNFMLIPAYGGVGAAFATAFSLSLKNILAVLHVRKQLNIRLLI